MPIIKSVIEQHAEEAAFNWILRSYAVNAPHYRVADLAPLDGMIYAHFDGLQIAGEAGWQVCREAMSYEDPGEIFAAGVLAFQSKISDRMDAVTTAVAADDELRQGLISALGWIDFDTIAGPAGKMLSSDSAFLKHIGLAAHAVHRRDPGVDMLRYLQDEDSLVRARTLKAAGELGRTDLLPGMLHHLQDEDEKCRFYAARSATLLGDRAAIETLKSLAIKPGVYARQACELAVRKMAYADAALWGNELCRKPEFLQTAIYLYGALGAPEAVPLLIECMSIPELARPSGEAFSMITGVDIDMEDLEGEPPTGFEAGPCEDPEDDNVEPDPDEDLPWPSVDLVTQWWNENQIHFKTETRHLCGQPLSQEQCRHVMVHGTQRQRFSAAIELVLMSPGQPLIEIRAPGFVQQRQ